MVFPSEQTEPPHVSNAVCHSYTVVWLLLYMTEKKGLFRRCQVKQGERQVMQQVGSRGPEKRCYDSLIALLCFGLLLAPCQEGSPTASEDARWLAEYHSGCTDCRSFLPGGKTDTEQSWRCTCMCCPCLEGFDSGKRSEGERKP